MDELMDGFACSGISPQSECETLSKLLSRKLAHGLLNPFQFPDFGLLFFSFALQLCLKTLPSQFELCNLLTQSWPALLEGAGC